MHLTLKFLGTVPEEKLPEIKLALSRAAIGLSSFPVEFAGVGTFPGGRRPRVVWAGVSEPSGALQKLWEGVDLNLETAGFPREKRKFTPHVTLGRVKGNINLERLARSVSLMAEHTWGRQEVASISLVRSTLTPSGAEYEDVGVFLLGER
jgi:2'-5' RNA ligase